MLKLSDLAIRPDLQFGPMLVSPSRRLVEGPGGHAHLEPLIMQVLLLLLDAGGKVVTRNELFDQCWGGVVVGDDSLNRAILKVRRTGAQVAPGLFEIETIPRTGYRLTGQILEILGPEAAASSQGPAMSRRLLIGGGAATAAAAAGAGLWWVDRSRTDPRFDELMARGDEAFRNGSVFQDLGISSGHSPAMIELYQQAVALEPGSARAWGLLAYFKALRADDAPTEKTASMVDDAEGAIRRALDIDPGEPNARVAMFLLQGRMLDWTARDRQLRSILATGPNNLPAMVELMPLLQAAGLTRESWGWNERILRASPFARPFLVVRSMKLWILGRLRESDNVIDRVRGLWPDYPFGYWVRFLLFAVTDRPRAALAMLESAPEKLGGPEDQAMWRTALGALDTRVPGAVAAARQVCLERARKEPILVNDIVMILSALGEIDAAFEVTNGFLFWRGRIVSTDQADGKKMDDYSRRMTQWLFTPPVAPMRSDPRFPKLCDEFGLSAYWRARGIKPDYQAYG
jgi:DNA-binding winged helix-turn-helix (wHTH) protein